MTTLVLLQREKKWAKLQKNNFKFYFVNKAEITGLLKETYIKKSTGVDKILPKLVKMTSVVLS